MKYYLALRFRERGDLHMTVHFYGRSDNQKSMAALVAKIGETIGRLQPSRFRLRCTTKLKMGFHKTVRALGPDEELPAWVHELAPRHWIPHITCEENRLDLLVTHVAIMSKQREICRWELR